MGILALPWARFAVDYCMPNNIKAMPVRYGEILKFHEGHNNATVATVASVVTHVPQLNTVYEMRTKILIKVIIKSIEANFCKKKRLLAARISPETTGATTIPHKTHPLRRPQ